jgi:hypothetical protein
VNTWKMIKCRDFSKLTALLGAASLICGSIPDYLTNVVACWRF